MNDRIFKLKKSEVNGGDVVYWMSREQRVQDNWSLIAAFNESVRRNSSLYVVFTLADGFLGATQRHYAFMAQGLESISEKLYKLNIHFTILKGNPPVEITKFINSNNIGALYTDFDPLRIKRQWKKQAADNINCMIYEVDAHNVVPCRIVSAKAEFAAYTIRPKIKKLLDKYLTNFPVIEQHPFNNGVVRCNIKIDLNNYAEYPAKSPFFDGGEDTAYQKFSNFLKNRLGEYSEKRNYPEEEYQSVLSPYLHFGNISAQRIAFDVGNTDANEDSKAAFLEELIIRKELSDNFCFYNENYDNYNGFPEWARKSLEEHIDDRRQYIYSAEQFENALTHDKYWNAAQKEMLITGKMHGYMRMYWAKKILEWTEHPAQALEIAIYLNDKYELDGRDPNGYTGIAWSIGGLHDRPWFEREIYGKIRYMNDSGLKRKCDIEAYVRKIQSFR